MNIKTKEIYSEVCQILDLLGNEYVDKLPNSLLDMLKEKRDINYNPKYTDNIPLDKQNIRKETISIIALLHLNYWCENEHERIEIEQILKKNEDKYQEELRKKYNPDNIFKRHKKEKYPEVVVKNEVAIVEYKESILRKLVNKVKNILHLLVI